MSDIANIGSAWDADSDGFPGPIRNLAVNNVMGDFEQKLNLVKWTLCGFAIVLSSEIAVYLASTSNSVTNAFADSAVENSSKLTSSYWLGLCTIMAACCLLMTILRFFALLYKFSISYSIHFIYVSIAAAIFTQISPKCALILSNSGGSLLWGKCIIVAQFVAIRLLNISLYFLDSQNLFFSTKWLYISLIDGILQFSTLTILSTLDFSTRDYIPLIGPCLICIGFMNVLLILTLLGKWLYLHIVDPPCLSLYKYHEYRLITIIVSVLAACSLAMTIQRVISPFRTDTKIVFSDWCWTQAFSTSMFALLAVTLAFTPLSDNHVAFSFASPVMIIEAESAMRTVVPKDITFSEIDIHTISDDVSDLSDDFNESANTLH